MLNVFHVFHRAPASRRWLLPTLAGLFLISGASALVYQMLWLRLLGLVFGVTVYAAATVWASFMAGLALGSLGAGWLADRVRRPLVWFGVSELGIALTASATPAVFDGVRQLYPTISPALHDNVAALTLLRAGLAFAVLLVPTVLMGVTLPLVLKSSVFRSEHLGSSAGVLYGANTIGALAGTLAAGLFLIPDWGTTPTFRTAVFLNVFVAAGALLLAAVRGSPQEQPAPRPTSKVVVEPLSLSTRRLVLLAFTVSGAAALGLEVIWLRVTVLLLGPTVYVVSALLASVLAGNAFGSLAVTRPLGRGGTWLVRLAFIETAVAFAAVLSGTTLRIVPAAVASIPRLLTSMRVPYLVPIAVGTALVALPTTFLMGVAFPIGLQLWVRRDDDRVAASRVGVFYALNVCGGIAGSLLVGFILLPWLGSRVSLTLVATALLASALTLILTCPLQAATRGVMASAVLVVFVALLPSVPEPVAALLAYRHPGMPIIWREEGVQSTVTIHDLGRGRRAMFAEGFHQADDTGRVTFVHYRIGSLALAVHPNPRSILVVGLGGGATAGAASRHEGVDVDVVELSPSVVRASDFFRHINFDLLRRQNVHLRIDDARTYLATTRRRYDVITGDTIQPVRAGSASLYSAEYFRLVRNALGDGGMALQWFDGTVSEYKLVARTFVSVFPHATLWGDGTLLMGTKEPLRLRRSDFEWKLQLPGRRDAFRSIGVTRFDDLVTTFVAGSDELRRFAGEGPLLTDDRPILEYFLSLPRDAPFDGSALKRDITGYVEP